MIEILQTFLLPSAWIALVTLVFLEIVLGIDNIVFLSIMSSKLPSNQQGHARTIGLLLAMLARIGLLFGISLLMRLTKPFFSFHAHWVEGAITGQSIIILVGGVFLLYKSVTEIHSKLETTSEKKEVNLKLNNFWGVIVQIVALDVILSLDSVLTAVGMVSFKDFGYAGAMTIMVTAIVIAIMTMLAFSGPISTFVNEHPAIQMLALSFLLLIGVMLLIEAAHLANFTVFGKEIQEVPKGYIYFAIAFSLLVEILNMKLSKRNKLIKMKNTSATDSGEVRKK